MTHDSQGPKWRRKKKKDKEKASVAANEGRDESSNVVYEKCLVTCEAILSAYPSCETEATQSFPTPLDTEDFVYSARTTKSTVPIIDSNATSHIFADQSTFTHYQPSSGNINGFRDGQSSILGCGSMKILTHLPSGNFNSIQLQNSCHIPNSSFSIISVSWLDNANCYTLFGAGWCIAFESTDNRQMIEDVRTQISSKVRSSGTQALHSERETPMLWMGDRWGLASACALCPLYGMPLYFRGQRME